MPINVTMPALSPTMEEGNLAKWLVKEGDKVASGDFLAEIETDKATMEVEAVDEGTIARIVVPAGTEGVKVNAVIAILVAEGESVDSSAAGGEGPPKAATAPDAKTEGALSADPAADNAAVGTVEDAKDPGLRGDGKPAEMATAPGASPETAPAPKRDGEPGERLFASPLARRIAREQGVDLHSMKGSGPHGRIVKADVDAAAAAPRTKAPEAERMAEPASAAKAEAAAPVKGQSDEQIKKLFAEGSYEAIPHDGLRKTIARRLVEAKTTIPHFYLTVDCELDALLGLREQLNAAAPTVKSDAGDRPSYKLSVNDLVIKALGLAMKAVPDANVSWTESAMLKHRHADVGVAVSIEGGLITPIIRRAEEKTLSTISNEMKDLAKRARSRKLKPEEYQGGTTAVSNLGMFGVKDFAAVINPPHATILAVGAGEERAVVKNGQIVIATMMSVTLSTDHRAVDGALGAQLVSAFKQLIENPLGMLV